MYISDFLKTIFFFSNRLILSTALYSTVLGENLNISNISRTKKFSDVTGIANFPHGMHADAIRKLYRFAAAKEYVKFFITYELLLIFLFCYSPGESL